MTTVFDTSAVIAVLRNEPGSDQLVGRFQGGAISAVNVAEIITHGVRSGIPAEEIRADFEGRLVGDLVNLGPRERAERRIQEPETASCVTRARILAVGI